jgi:hypothetical protein
VLGVILGVERVLGPLSVRRLTVLCDPPIGSLTRMAPPAPERTTQVLPIGVAVVRQKPNPAVNAANHVTLKLGTACHRRVQRAEILLHRRCRAVVLVPVGPTREKPLDGYGKRARFSVILCSVCFTPSLYLPDAKASRGRARFFSALQPRPQPPPSRSVPPLSLSQDALVTQYAHSR